MSNICNVFAYGTLRTPAMLQAVMSRVPTMRPDSLQGFRRGYLRVNGKQYFVAEPHVAARMHGYLLQDITEQELALLDDYETAAYARQLVTLESGGTAWLYCRNVRQQPSAQ